MNRTTIHIDDELLERATCAAQARDLTLSAFIRDALERDLARTQRLTLTCVGVISTGGKARAGEYRADA